jgi:hypothetical protein
MREAMLHRRADNFLKGKIHRERDLSFKWLLFWCWQRRTIRYRWVAKGLAMRRRIRFAQQNSPFQIWRAYKYYKKQVLARVCGGGLEFKFMLAPQAVPRPFFTASMKKKRAREVAVNLKNEEARVRALEVKKRTDAANKEMKQSRLGKNIKVGRKNSPPRYNGMDDSTMGSGNDSDNDDSDNDSEGKETARSRSELTTGRNTLTVSPDVLTSPTEVGSDTSRGSMSGQMTNRSKAKGSKKKSLIPVVLSARSNTPSDKLVNDKKLAVWKKAGKGAWKAPFKWTLVIGAGLAVDSDEELDFIPSGIQTAYDLTVGQKPLPVGEELPEGYLQHIDLYTLSKIEDMAANWKKWEIFSLVEYVGRFLRFGVRAFRNWRYFALFKKKARLSRKLYWQNREKEVLTDWTEWMRIKGLFLVFCLYVCFFLSGSLSLFPFLSLSLSLSLFLFLFLLPSLSLSLSFPLSLALSHQSHLTLNLPCPFPLLPPIYQMRP